MSAALVWVTRAQPGAERTSRAVAALGWTPLVAPLIETRALAARVDLAGVAALAFTSAAGVSAFAGRCQRRDLPVFAVGEATAAAARAAGFAAVTDAAGDVAALAAAIIAARADLAGAVLHVGPLRPAGDLVGALLAAGIEARSLALYETVPAALPEGLPAALPGLAAVLVHAPSAARALAALDLPERLPILCLSAAVAAPLKGRCVRIAARPDEASLLVLLGRELADEKLQRARSRLS